MIFTINPEFLPKFTSLIFVVAGDTSNRHQTPLTYKRLKNDVKDVIRVLKNQKREASPKKLASLQSASSTCQRNRKVARTPQGEGASSL